MIGPGTEFLHRILFDAGLSHEYRLVRGADHLGETLGPRFQDAFGFQPEPSEPVTSYQRSGLRRCPMG